MIVEITLAIKSNIIMISHGHVLNVIENVTFLCSCLFSMTIEITFVIKSVIFYDRSCFNHHKICYFL